ncbi:ferritin-like domain-containing protein [Ralstonia solanacearum]|uniref:ferritin-like domain-containing protein n=1 Tax=Ralstonia solanacearum TaxID=305 RepID=UPI0012393A9D|nr:ferritin-like domain-containing protein [Ralstonia solanacearum]AYB50145.1 hypothetical protein C2I38_00735 [Ralstonia solanacearum]AYB54693.1 hypothetical protein C2L97_00730 [Ralstonia solanacearum]
MNIREASNNLLLYRERSLDDLATDISAVPALAQAAVNVELFTIPLYMTGLYSVFGTHEINAQNISYYQGRRWPGMAPTARPATREDKAFNLVFSVFIQEMLHLQMAANISTAIGGTPSFTSPALQKPDHGWSCYGPEQTTIPHVINLRDTTRYHDTKVSLGALNKNTLDLFCAIEQTEKDAMEILQPGKRKDYFPTVPFKDWNPSKGETDLPMFGSIGHMYECYAQYLRIEYTDGQTLWQKLFDPNCVQQDMFNSMVKGHPRREYPRIETALNQQDLADPVKAFNKVITFMSAITDQGEGSQIALGRSLLRYQLGPVQPAPLPLTDVKEKYREDRQSLEIDYPSYTATGQHAPSADAEARYHYAAETHLERFEALRLELPHIMTWEKWHADPKNTWTAGMLTTPDYDPAKDSQAIPSPQAIADALNRLKQQRATEYPILSKVAVGAIAGITTVLDTYWKIATTAFPYPSMVGSGDRVSLCWAVFGQAPDLGLGIGAPDDKLLYHACQALDLNGDGQDSCAAIEIYHSCRGSNGCKAQGGCGFAQLDAGGGSCGHGSSGSTASADQAAKAAPYRVRGRKSHSDATDPNLCGGPTPAPGPYSAPSDNRCGGLGGCAVPISASQLYPEGGTMVLYDFVGPQHEKQQIGEMTFALGDSVYGKAWQAYKEVMASRGKQIGDPPKPTDLRIALPPST